MHGDNKKNEKILVFVWIKSKTFQPDGCISTGKKECSLMATLTLQFEILNPISSQPVKKTG
jgi:hypothetical protein